MLFLLEKRRVKKKLGKHTLDCRKIYSSVSEKNRQKDESFPLTSAFVLASFMAVIEGADIELMEFRKSKDTVESLS